MYPTSTYSRPSILYIIPKSESFFVSLILFCYYINMKTLQILMNQNNVELVLNRTEENFRPMVRYIKRYFDEEDYPYLSVLVVEYPDDVNRDTFDGSILFTKWDIETSDSKLREQWWIRMLWLPHDVAQLVLDFNNAIKWKN